MSRAPPLWHAKGPQGGRVVCMCPPAAIAAPRLSWRASLVPAVASLAAERSEPLNKKSPASVSSRRRDSSYVK